MHVVVVQAVKAGVFFGQDEIFAALCEHMAEYFGAQHKVVAGLVFVKTADCVEQAFAKEAALDVETAEVAVFQVQQRGNGGGFHIVCGRAGEIAADKALVVDADHFGGGVEQQLGIIGHGLYLL